MSKSHSFCLGFENMLPKSAFHSGGKRAEVCNKKEGTFRLPASEPSVHHHDLLSPEAVAWQSAHGRRGGLLASWWPESRGRKEPESQYLIEGKASNVLT